MAVILADSTNPAYDGNLSTANAFYRVESYNMAMFSATDLVLSTARTWDITFANAGNCKGVVLGMVNTTAANDKSAYVTLEETKSTCTITIASPGVVTNAGHGLANDTEVRITTTGALPTGLTAGTSYFVRNAAANTLELSATAGGASINTTGSQSGTHTLWVVRASKTLTYNEITNSVSDKRSDGWITPFVFGTPYAVDTTASKWRLRATQTGGGSGNWSIRTSNATAPFYAAWCDNQVTFANNDSVIAKDIIYIDQSATVKGVLGTGDTDRAVAMLACRSTTPGLTTCSNIRWKPVPTANMTLTVDGCIIISAHGGFQVGTPITWTGSLAASATSGTLSSVWPYASGTYQVIFNRTDDDQTGTHETIEYQNCTFTNGSATVSFATGLTEACSTSAWVPCPKTYANQITFLSSPTVGTSGGVGFGDAERAIVSFFLSGLTRKATLAIYGEIPAVERTTLAADASSGQPNFTTAVATGWVNGDSIAIGKATTRPGTQANLSKTVSSSAGTTVTCTGNLSYLHKSGGHAVRLNGYGFKIASDTTTFLTSALGAPSNFKLFGVETYYHRFILTITTVGTSLDDSAYKSKHEVKHCSHVSANAGLVYYCAPPSEGFEFSYCNAVGGAIFFSSLNSTSSNLGRTGTLKVDNCCTIISSSAYPALTGPKTIYIRNCFGYQTSFSFFNLSSCVKPIIKDNYFWGQTSTTRAAIEITSPVGSYAADNISGNTYNFCDTALRCVAGASKELKFTNEIFGNESANTYDVVFDAGTLTDIWLASPTGNVTLDTTFLPDTVEGTHFRISDNNDTANDDKGYLTYGRFQRTGDGLSDTTVRTAGTGKFAMRFQPTDSAETLKWTQDIPTGNIQNKTMTVTVWVKFNSANYYAGTHIKPTLKAIYDQSTEVTATAVTGTGWQQLGVTLTPTTTYGQVTLTIEGATDATGTDAYFYVDDINIAYPAGVQVDLGGIDLWARGLPIMPTIATDPSLGGVWDELTTSHNIPGSFGQVLTPVYSGSVVSATSSTVVLDSGASPTSNLYDYNIIIITSGTGVGQSRTIGSYNGTTKTVTLNRNWITNPDNTSKFVIVPFISVGNAVWEELLSNHTTTGTYGTFIKKLLTVAKFLGLK